MSNWDEVCRDCMHIFYAFHCEGPLARIARTREERHPVACVNRTIDQWRRHFWVDDATTSHAPGCAPANMASAEDSHILILVLMLTRRLTTVRFVSPCNGRCHGIASSSACRLICKLAAIRSTAGRMLDEWQTRACKSQRKLRKVCDAGSAACITNVHAQIVTATDDAWRLRCSLPLQAQAARIEEEVRRAGAGIRRVLQRAVILDGVGVQASAE